MSNPMLPSYAQTEAKARANLMPSIDNRRSLKKSFNWVKYQLYLKKHLLMKPKIYVNIFELRVGNNYIM